MPRVVCLFNSELAKGYLREGSSICEIISNLVESRPEIISSKDWNFWILLRGASVRFVKMSWGGPALDQPVIQLICKRSLNRVLLESTLLAHTVWLFFSSLFSFRPQNQINWRVGRIGTPFECSVVHRRLFSSLKLIHNYSANYFTSTFGTEFANLWTLFIAYETR